MMTVGERSLVYGAARTLKRLGYSVPLRWLYSNHFTSGSLRGVLEHQGLTTVQVSRHNSPMAYGGHSQELTASDGSSAFGCMGRVPA